MLRATGKYLRARKRRGFGVQTWQYADVTCGGDSTELCEHMTALAKALEDNTLQAATHMTFGILKGKDRLAAVKEDLEIPKLFSRRRANAVTTAAELATKK